MAVKSKNNSVCNARQWQCIVDACKLLEQAHEPISFTKLAASVGMSPWHFHRLFKQVLGITPKQYSNALQRQRTQQQLKTSASIAEALYAAGFDSMSQFYSRVPGMLGMSASEFRSGGGGVAIDYATAPTALGELLVAATGEGICSVQFGDNTAQLVDELEHRFKNADIAQADQSFEETVACIASLVDKPDTPVDLPLDIQGTAFQEKVWRVLRGIPVGTTMNYKEVATAMGKPSAHRAVANACGANPLALLIPCHRVVRADGGTGGYRWGLERKQVLLETEADKQHLQG
jgi:AraC family transcriptional regulator of adaptative response/methylated-DNA-[protein]-cysteine methyltransferase